ncbi:MAG: hypothetical protein ACP5UD_10390, partial [Conexivisphaera sp.]
MDITEARAHGRSAVAIAWLQRCGDELVPPRGSEIVEREDGAGAGRGAHDDRAEALGRDGRPGV